MRLTIIVFFIIGVTIGLVICSAGAAFVDIIAGDSFMLVGDRTAGSMLKSSTAEKGGKIWEAGNNLFFTGNVANGYITINIPDGVPLVSQTAVVSFDPPHNQVISIQAKIDPASSSWTSLILQDQTSLWQGNILRLLIQADGRCSLVAKSGSTSKVLFIGMAPGFVKGSLNLLEMIYDGENKTVQVRLNDTAVGSVYNLTGKGIKPVIKYGGIAVFNASQSGSVRIDDFKLSAFPTLEAAKQLKKGRERK